MRWANVINALVGIWFIIAPFVLKYDDMRYAMYARIVGGAILLALAGWAVFSGEARKAAVDPVRERAGRHRVDHPAVRAEPGRQAARDPEPLAPLGFRASLDVRRWRAD